MVGGMDSVAGAASGTVAGTSAATAKLLRKESEQATARSLPWQSNQAPNASGFEPRQAPPCRGPPATVSVQLQALVAVRWVQARRAWAPDAATTSNSRGKSG